MYLTTNAITLPLIENPPLNKKICNEFYNSLLYKKTIHLLQSTMNDFHGIRHYSMCPTRKSALFTMLSLLK